MEMKTRTTGPVRKMHPLLIMAIVMALITLLTLVMMYDAARLRDAHTVEGIVERVGQQDGSFLQAEARFIKLEDGDTVYECWVSDRQACSTLEPGDYVVMRVGRNDRGVNNFVGSIELK